MSVTGLHPEHLIEKDARGTLDDAERKQLEAHLAQCAACRFERTLRADFADELAGEDPPVRISLSDVQRQTPPLPLPSRRAIRFTWLVAAAVLLLVVSAVASEPGRRVWMPMLGITISSQTNDAPPPSARIEIEPSPPVIVHVDMPAPTVTVEKPVSSAPVVVVENSQTLFDKESDARRSGDYERAIALHSDLVTRFPDSKEAQVSRVTIARMLLDRGDASSALVGFDAYLKHGGGELSEEARLGRATALERLGRKEEARAAWQALLDAHPDGPYAAQAKARIEASN